MRVMTEELSIAARTSLEQRKSEMEKEKLHETERTLDHEVDKGYVNVLSRGLFALYAHPPARYT
jgi:hypothetical protein